jgi:hypothetical protein
MASAPTLDVVRREVVAVEHPMMVKNLDKALKTFGLGAETTGLPFARVSIRITCCFCTCRENLSDILARISGYV